MIIDALGWYVVYDSISHYTHCFNLTYKYRYLMSFSSSDTTCLDEPCANNATCSPLGSKYLCSCVDGKFIFELYEIFY